MVVLLGIFTGNYPTLHWLLIVFPLLVLLIMTFGVGMILGAVTHVIVNDTKKGYGIFITTMLKEAEN